MDMNRNGIPDALETVLSISGIMAIVSLAIAGVMLILGDADVPAWLVAIIGGTSGSAVQQHGQRSTQRMAYQNGYRNGRNGNSDEPAPTETDD